jgi:hypothetical protein
LADLSVKNFESTALDDPSVRHGALARKGTLASTSRATNAARREMSPALQRRNVAASSASTVHGLDVTIPHA